MAQHNRPAAVLVDGVPRIPWHSLSPEEVAAYWHGSLAGLSPEQARLARERSGPNRLDEPPPPSLLRRFLKQILDFTVLALLVAALIAGGLAWLSPPQPGMHFLERFGDSLAILAIVILNAILGLAQETRAERALRALAHMTAPTAKVVRAGQAIEVAAADLVPGDLILVEEGDLIPADARLLQASELEIEEGALTGESLPIAKDAGSTWPKETPLAERANMVYMGTRVARGRGRGLVANTGMFTELGTIAGMLARVEPEPTPLEEDLASFGKRVVLGCIAVSVIVFVAGLVFGHHAPRELFLVAVALAVAAIPEGLPAVTTIVLALGTTRMAARHALVRRLPAVETLGCAQIICTDKTGTLTQNVMGARALWVGGARYQVGGGPRAVAGEIALVAGVDGPAGDAAANAPSTTQAGDLALALRAAAHAQGAHLTATADGSLGSSGDPTDAALLVLAWKGGTRQHAPLIGERPFSSQRRMASVTVDESGTTRCYVRGAPEALLALSSRIHWQGAARPLAAEQRELVTAEAARWAGRALRVIALAYRDGTEETEGDLTFLALVGINDPPRPEAGPAIARARQAGIETLMITGDHPATARAIAEEIGLWREGDLLLSGAEIDAIDQQRLEEDVGRLRVVARATAGHKLRIVEALKARGMVCAMTGDGANDAPAVKAASIGVAMGKSGTDVTKEAASLVLADDNYATIVAAVEEGRAIFANIRKFVFFLLSSNAGLVLLVLAAPFLGWVQPLAPIQILWINLITNGLPALALGVDGREPEQMRQPPRAPGGAVLTGWEYVDMLGVGAVMAVTAGLAFQHFLVPGDAAALTRARTVCFAILAVGPLLHAFSCRSKTKSAFRGLASNPTLWGAVIIGIALEAAAIYIPAMRPVFRTGNPGGAGLLWIAAMSLAPFAVGEVVKIWGGAPSVRKEIE